MVRQMISKQFRLALAFACPLSIATPVWAGNLVYTPINPSFGGSPLNSGHLLGIASAQREATASDVASDEDDDRLAPGLNNRAGSDAADLFVRQLQGRLFSALAGQVTEAIFGENPQNNGTVTFGDTSVTFDRTLDSIRLTIIDSLDGSVTEIVVPQLVAN
ncbi:MAG: curli assembly protein CsgF [Pseudomonadota bacterium]|nr:curli assembly protein CsgF [Pseudomonadota bacterium]